MYKKYFKYKSKYLKLKEIEQSGGTGGVIYDKTIILSCKEFDDTVDKLIALDGIAGPIMLDGKNIITSDNSGGSSPTPVKSDTEASVVNKFLDKIKSLDADIGKIAITDEKFHQFLEDIA